MTMAGLSNYEKNLFQSILKHYESHNYKKGLTNCDTLLASRPNHGETFALKALLFQKQGHKQKAYQFARSALRFDCRSYLCWLVLGGLQKDDHNYHAAALCYKNADKLDTNQQILRDLAFVQAQIRDFTGLLDTRKKIAKLTSKRGVFAERLGCSVAAYFAKKYKEALAQWQLARNSMDKKMGGAEISELLLFKATILEGSCVNDGSDYQTVVKFLDDNKATIWDKTLWRELKVKFLFKLNKHSDAITICEELVKINPENTEFHSFLREAHQLHGDELSAEQTDKLSTIYDGLKKDFPKCHAIDFLPLTFLKGDAFKEKYGVYASKALLKGVPSLFQTLKYLYTDADKVKIMEEWMLAERVKEENPDTQGIASNIFWINFYLAQHYCKLNRFQEALDTVKLCEDHTPTVIDIYLVKGRIYNRAGDIKKASAAYEEAREMDLADRFVNTKSVRYLMRAGKPEQAETTIEPFTRRPEDTETTKTNIYHMQVMWYEYEQGCSWNDLGRPGRALKYLISVDNHFKTIRNNQFDFHHYCLRRVTVNSYVNMLKFEDTLESHKFWVRAAKLVVNIYMSLYDKREETLAGLNADRAAAEKELIKRDLAYLTPKAQEWLKKKGGLDKFLDIDPEGDKLERTTRPLKCATDFFTRLHTFAADDIETHVLGFGLYLRLKDYEQVLVHVKRAVEIAPTDARTHKIVCLFFNKMESVEVEDKKPFEEAKSAILGGKAVAQFNESYLEANKSSMQHRVACAEVLLVLGKKDEALALLQDLSDAGYPVQHAEKAFSVITQSYDKATAEAYKLKCNKEFPLALAFQPPVVEEEKKEPEEPKKEEKTEK